MKNKTKAFITGLAALATMYTANVDAQSLRERREARQSQPTQTEQVTTRQTTPAASYQEPKTSKPKVSNELEKLLKNATTVTTMSIGEEMEGFKVNIDPNKVPIDTTATIPFNSVTHTGGTIKVGELSYQGSGVWEYVGDALKGLSLGPNYFTLDLTAKDRPSTKFTQAINFETTNAAPVLGTLYADFISTETGDITSYELEAIKTRSNEYTYTLGEELQGDKILKSYSVEVIDIDQNLITDSKKGLEQYFTNNTSSGYPELSQEDSEDSLYVFEYDRSKDPSLSGQDLLESRGPGQYTTTTTFKDEVGEETKFKFIFKKDYKEPEWSEFESIKKEDRDVNIQLYEE